MGINSGTGKGHQEEIQKLRTEPEQQTAQTVQTTTATAIVNSPPVGMQSTVTVQQQPSPFWRKDFKISGQIGEPGQKDKLTFSSLARQIENSRNRGYPEIEIVDAVVRAIFPSLQLRSYLEGIPNLTLPTLRCIIPLSREECNRTVQAACFRSAAKQKDPSKLPPASPRSKAKGVICISGI